MKKFFFATVFTIIFIATVQAQSVAQRIDALMNDELLLTSDVAIAVYDLDADAMLYEHRADKMVRPASTQKVVTTVAALQRLGGDYTIDTELFEGTSPAYTFYLRGAVDPLFDVEDLEALFSVIPDGFVIDTLYADCTFMDSIYWGPGWSWDDATWRYQPYITPLMLCGGGVEVTVSPSSLGMPPTVEVVPSSSYYTIVNEAVSGKGDKKFSVERDWLEGSNVIRLRGNCTKVVKEELNMADPLLFFLTVVRERLALRGITIHHFAKRPVPCDAPLLKKCRRPIGEVVDEALMESNNLCAEALLFHLAKCYGVLPATWEGGAKIISDFMEHQIGTKGKYNIADGSGLSLYNYISARAMLDVLRYAYTAPAIYSQMLKGLPQSGISGTMKNRLKGTPAYKKVFAKTGTVKGVCTLAGYAKAANGHTYAFVLLNNGSMSASAVRRWQDKVCDALCR